MRLPRLWVLLFAAAALAGVPGCKGQCRQLTEKLCECSTNSLEKQNCLTVASSRESNSPPTAADDAACAKLLPGCDCHAIDTAAGKVACGLARPAP